MSRPINNYIIGSKVDLYQKLAPEGKEIANYLIASGTIEKRENGNNNVVKIDSTTDSWVYGDEDQLSQLLIDLRHIKIQSSGEDCD